MPFNATDKIAYRIDEAVKASGLGRSFLYEKMAEGKLRSVKVGGRRLILRIDLLDFLNQGGEPEASAQAPSPALPEAKIVSAAIQRPAQLELPLKPRR
ncbi:helix-turn-helix domain-containing protein [Asticcacaulis sp. ZE23SCel15]|uniref:helix-turn-helix domain-containing protein n=1 Tax=Asticcacaulis sp. ZE23SCel15 TaxID=3059027 RepID=UPI00265DED2A|nr:helix-turn-helix domain-containing protein [Asticcacaulis sp. ZE23SCel15]WKL55989.1 helix-turn-helix domain-containing protein [Asticcacaulis sp. ZE23SCel15]